MHTKKVGLGILVLLIILANVLIQCSAVNKAQPVKNAGKTDSSKGLKDYYEDYFSMGVAVSVKAIKNDKEAAFIIKQFSGITPENAMKTYVNILNIYPNPQYVRQS